MTRVELLPNYKLYSQRVITSSEPIALKCCRQIGHESGDPRTTVLGNIRLRLCQHEVLAAVWVNQRAASPHCWSTPRIHWDPPLLKRTFIPSVQLAEYDTSNCKVGYPTSFPSSSLAIQPLGKSLQLWALLGHHAKTLHSAYPPTPLPSASIRFLHRRRLSLSYAQHPPRGTWS